MSSHGFGGQLAYPLAIEERMQRNADALPFDIPFEEEIQ
jgi:hypothetical protein